MRDVRDEVATHRLQAPQIRQVLYDEKELAVREASRDDPLKTWRLGPLELRDTVGVIARPRDRIDHLVVAHDVHKTPTGERRPQNLGRRAVRALDLAIAVGDDDRVAELVDQDREAIPLGHSVVSLAGDAIGHRAERVTEAARLVGTARLETRGATAGDGLRASRQRADWAGDRAR